MAWDFSTEPEFEEQLAWMRRFVRDEIFPLESHDIVLLATDGVLEMLSGGPRDVCSTMGQCQLVDILRKSTHDLAEIHRRILNAGDASTAGRDDVALLGLELTE